MADEGGPHQRVVSREFGHFLRYYADAPVIEQPTDRRGDSGKETEGKSRRERRREKDGKPQAEEGYTRLFINLGKRDNFRPAEHQLGQPLCA